MIRDLAIITTVGLCWSAAVVIAIWRHNTREGQRQDRQARNIERHNRERARLRAHREGVEYEGFTMLAPWEVTAGRIAGRLEDAAD